MIVSAGFFVSLWTCRRYMGRLGPKTLGGRQRQLSTSPCLQVSGHLVCSRLLTPWIFCVPTDCTLLSPFLGIGELTSHLPPGALRVSGG